MLYTLIMTFLKLGGVEVKPNLRRKKPKEDE